MDTKSLLPVRKARKPYTVYLISLMGKQVPDVSSSIPRRTVKYFCQSHTELLQKKSGRLQTVKPGRGLGEPSLVKFNEKRFLTID
jgi:hypothetical protein